MVEFHPVVEETIELPTVEVEVEEQEELRRVGLNKTIECLRGAVEEEEGEEVQMADLQVAGTLK